MIRRDELRSNQRLKLRYPIRVEEGTETKPIVLARTVTQNVAARGAYFSTFDAGNYRLGQEVGVTVTVPHRLAGNGPDVMIDLKGRGRVVRIEGPEVHGSFGEDGTTISGVAIAFAGSLTFQSRWV